MPNKLLICFSYSTLFFCLLMLLFLLSACSQKSANTLGLVADQNPIQTFQDDIDRLRKDNGIPGMSVAVIKDQQIVFAKGFGLADIENRILATADTPFNIASLSKPFAAAILMKLVEKGRLDLDTAIADTLKNTDFNSKYVGRFNKGENR